RAAPSPGSPDRWSDPRPAPPAASAARRSDRPGAVHKSRKFGREPRPARRQRRSFQPPRAAPRSARTSPRPAAVAEAARDRKRRSSTVTLPTLTINTGPPGRGKGSPVGYFTASSKEEGEIRKSVSQTDAPGRPVARTSSSSGPPACGGRDRTSVGPPGATTAT